MTSFPALDVAIGLSFAYFLFSVLSTTITETISRFLKMRARKLEGWLKDVLTTDDHGMKSYNDFMQTPIIKALLRSTGRPTGKRAKETRPPSYIPSPHFVAAALSAGGTAIGVGEQAEDTWAKTGQELASLKGTIAGDALQEIYDRADGDLVRFRADAEAWFDDQMERLSGVYRRWSQAVVWVIGAALVVALNANTFRMAETLWNDPSKRAAIVAQAGRAAADKTANEDINSLPLPIGWSHASYGGVGWLWAVVGILITLGAISLGAPFWFDALSRLARIRQTGTPPPAANATRGGEGDQSRKLPSVADWQPK